MPKKRVMADTRMSGTSVPASGVQDCDFQPDERQKGVPVDVAELQPRTPAIAGSADRPVFTPTRIGVPAAPKLTGVLWMIMPAVTAAIPGKPNPTSNGTATAAGVPNPADPSMNEPNNQAMMMTCTRRSGVMLGESPDEWS